MNIQKNNEYCLDGKYYFILQYLEESNDKLFTKRVENSTFAEKTPQ